MNSRERTQLDAAFKQRQNKAQLALLVGTILKNYGSLTPFGQAKTYAVWLDDTLSKNDQVKTKFQAYCIAGELCLIAFDECENAENASSMASTAAQFYDKALGLIGKLPEYEDLEEGLQEKGNLELRKRNGVNMFFRL